MPPDFIYGLRLGARNGFSKDNGEVNMKGPWEPRSLPSLLGAALWTPGDGRDIGTTKGKQTAHGN